MDQWYYKKAGLDDGNKVGPVTDKELKQLAYNGKVQIATKVTSPTRTKGKWINASSISGLSELIAKGEKARDAVKQLEAAELDEGPSTSSQSMQPSISTQPPPINNTANENDFHPAPSNSKLPLILSVVAVAISLVTLTRMMFSAPLGYGMSHYDFTTPQNALNSDLAIKVNGDIVAQIEIERLKAGDGPIERKDTIKVHKESSYQGNKLLFVSYKENGLMRYDIESFEKHSDSGLWFRSYVQTYDMDDEVLERAIIAWKEKVGP